MHIRSEEEMEAFGQRITRLLLLRQSSALRNSDPNGLADVKKASVLALVGELGAGKTTFMRGVAKGLGITRKITSPTFVLARRYRIPSHKPYAVSYKATKKSIKACSLQPTAGYKWLWHFDWYRLRNAHDLEELGFREILGDPHAIVAIEWADRVANALPKNAKWLFFGHRAHERNVVVKNLKSAHPSIDSG